MTHDNEEPSAASAGSLAWIPVTERLPTNGQRVIAFFPDEIESVGEATFRNNEENRWLTEHGSWFEATHWMPLPAPPTDAK